MGIDWVVVTLAVFVMGVTAGRYLARRSIQKMREEIDELKTRLQNCERLLSESYLSGPTGEEFPGDECFPLSEGRAGASDEGGSVRHTFDYGEMSRVMLTKTTGKAGEIEPKTTIVGWEERPPKVGEIYRVVLRSGKTFRTSPVKAVGQDYLKTENSTYVRKLIQ